MILVLGPSGDPMIAAVSGELHRRNARFATVFLHEIPNTVRLNLRLPLGDSDLESLNGFHVPFDKLRAVYQRVGFSNFQVAADYSNDEVRYVNEECQAALLGAFNNLPCLVVNRPVAGGSNASKPHQIDLIQEYGFSVPRTLVTTLPGFAQEFFEQEDGEVIYKSVSYHRSVVKRMTKEDIERLDTVKQCPVQLQEMLEGVDYRVHVVAHRESSLAASTRRKVAIVTTRRPWWWRWIASRGTSSASASRWWKVWV